jgi:hypothetical protein
MEVNMTTMNAKLDQILGTLPKIHEIDAQMQGLVKNVQELMQENTSLRAELVKKDKAISTLTEQVNRIDQNSRSSSIRIIGLPISRDTPSAQITEIVFKEILAPTLAAAKACGDMSTQAVLMPYALIVNAFSIPSKNNASSCTVIVKLSSELIRSLVFKHKKDSLPKATDSSTNRVRSKYSIFEDLAPGTHALFRSFADDPRVMSTWTFSGQVRFRTKDSETVYKARLLTDTYESVVKPPTTSMSH